MPATIAPVVVEILILVFLILVISILRADVAPALVVMGLPRTLVGTRRADKGVLPFVLDKEHPRLRGLLVVDEQSRAKFWAKVEAQNARKKPPKREE